MKTIVTCIQVQCETPCSKEASNYNIQANQEIREKGNKKVKNKYLDILGN